MKTRMEKGEEGVIRTAREALHCKSDTSSTLPVIKALYQARSSVLHTETAALLSDMAQQKEITQLVLLGAGLDTSYDGYATSRTRVYAVDFHQIIEERRGGGREQREAKAEEGDEGEVTTMAVVLIEADLRHVSGLKDKLLAAGFAFDKPTLFVAEFVLNYLDSTSVIALLAFLASQFPSSLCSKSPSPAAKARFLSYDLVLPRSSWFAQAMRAKFAERGAPLLYCSTSRDEHKRLFTSAGWEQATCKSISSMLQSLEEESQAARAAAGEARQTSSSSFPSSSSTSSSSTTTTTSTTTSLQLFDEYASLALLHKHYSVTIASTERRLVREARQEDGPAIAALFAECFAEYAEKYEAVHKFVKLACKQLGNLKRHYSKKGGRGGGISFWVAVSEDEGQNEAGAKGGGGGVGGAGEGEGGSSRVIVGCVGIKQKNGTVGSIAQLSHMAVSAKYRRRGIGAALLDTALESFFLHEQEQRPRCASSSSSSFSSTIELSVLRDLSAARALYASKGFVSRKEPEDCGGGCFLIHMGLEHQPRHF